MCRVHGGAAPQVKAKARERMMEMVYPALARLERIIKNPATSDADAIRAMREVFDRAHDAGLGRTAKLEVAVESIWAQLDTVEIARDDGTTAEIDHETREELGHEIEDWAEERAEPAEPEGEPLDHDGHEVVPGELAEPTGDATSAPPPWERAVVRRGR